MEGGKTDRETTISKKGKVHKKRIWDGYLGKIEGARV